MTLPNESSVRCAGCGASSPAALHATINATHSPELRARVVDGTLFRFTCPACQATTNLLFDLLFHDVERRFMVQLAADPSTLDVAGLDAALDRVPPVVRRLMEGYVTRIVSDPFRMREKILLFEAGVDDRVFECFKLRLKIQSGETKTQLFFSGIDAEQLVLAKVGPEKSEYVAIPIETWQQHASVFAHLPPPNERRWSVVDEAAALAIYQSMAPPEA